MGKRYVQHSDLCGCERCAIQADREHPSPVFDEIEDPNVCNGCGGEGGRCYCWDDPGDDFEDEDDDIDCGLMPDGQCTKAGSEECDWVCGALHKAASK